MTSLEKTYVKSGVAFVFLFDDRLSPNKCGSEKDMANLDETFSQLNCTVQKYKNLKYDQFEMILESISASNYGNVDLLAFVVLSHGKDNLITTADEKMFGLDSFYELLHKNKSLECKRKLFFVNGFRNKEYISQFEHVDFLKRSQSSNENENNVVSQKMLNAFRFYFVSYQMRAYSNEEENESCGSLIISTLCKHLKENGKSKSFLNNITAILIELEKTRVVNKKVQYEIQFDKFGMDLSQNDFIFSS